MTWLGVMVTGPAAAAFLAGAFFAFLADGAPSAACVVPAASPPAQEGEPAGWRVSPRVTNVVGAAPAELRPGPASLRVKVLWSCARISCGGGGVAWRVCVRARVCVARQGSSEHLQLLKLALQQWNAVRLREWHRTGRNPSVPHAGYQGRLVP